mgnify:CR=1 FL=1
MVGDPRSAHPGESGGAQLHVNLSAPVLATAVPCMLSTDVVPAQWHQCAHVLHCCEQQLLTSSAPVTYEIDLQYIFQSAGLTGKNTNLVASAIQYICFVCGTVPAIFYMVRASLEIQGEPWNRPFATSQDKWGRRNAWIWGGILQGGHCIQLIKAY